MNYIIIYLMSSTLWLAVWYLFYRFILANTYHFAFIRIYLLGALLGSLIIPLLHFPLPDYSTIPLFELDTLIIVAYGNPASSANELSTIEYSSFIMWGYVAGVLLCGGLLLMRWIHIWRFIQQHDCHKTEAYTLVPTHHSFPTSSFFRYIFWGEKGYVEEFPQVLEHEMTHVRLKHSWDILIWELVRVLWWFHPLIYLYRRAIVLNHEFQADQGAIKQGNVQQYVTQLLSVQFQSSFLPHHYLRGNKLATRVNMLRSWKRRNMTIWQYLSILFVSCLLISGHFMVFNRAYYAFVQKEEHRDNTDIDKTHVKHLDALIESQKGLNRTLDGLIKKDREKNANYGRHLLSLQEEVRELKDQLGISDIKGKEGQGADANEIGEKEKLGSELLELEALLTQQKEAFDKEQINEINKEPDVEAFIMVDEEPQPINLVDIQRTIGYPRIARDAGIQGNVVVRILVNEKGDFVKYVVLNSVHPILEQVVTNQIVNLRFSPAVKDGKPLMFWVNVPFTFRLLN